VLELFWELLAAVHRVANDFPEEKMAAGSVLVKHDGDESGEQNVPVVPTRASLPSTAVYPMAKFLAVPAALAIADGPIEASDDVHSACSLGSTYAQSAVNCPDSMFSTSPVTTACGDPSPGDADAGAMTVTPDPSAAAQDGELPPPAAAAAAEDATPAALLAPPEGLGVLEPPELHPATETARTAITPYAARP
jgi:hypothetical protein